LIETVAAALRDQCRLPPGNTILVGVSGGPDSLTLLHLLRLLGYRVTTAHLDHSLRPESAREAETVRQAAQQMGADFILEQADVTGYARAHGLSIEEAARDVRYRFLFREAERIQAAVVAVGHTADDQAETILMHFLRGAGAAGLRGMPVYSLPNPWSQAIPLIRPLLSVWRTEIEAYCASARLQPHHDPSNADRAFYRNRLRHELIPLLESYNPGFKRRLEQMAATLTADYAFLETNAEEAARRAGMETGDGFVGLDATVLAGEPESLQRMVLRRAIACVRPGLRDIDFAAVERARRFLLRPSRSRQADLAAGLALRLYDGRLVIADWQVDLDLHPAEWPALTSDQPLDLPTPGIVQLGRGWIIRVELVDAPDPANFGQDAFLAYLDLSAMPLSLRTRRPGDRFRPLGLNGRSQKLSDFMINAHLPAPARAAWPLVIAADGQIAWAPGFRPADPFRLSSRTLQAVKITLIYESAV
jgi:tRNA(Ile)-lysidine synthase